MNSSNTKKSQDVVWPYGIFKETIYGCDLRKLKSLSL